MSTDLWVESRGEGPLMATAIHSGHEMRRELLPLLALDDDERAREEDAYSDYWVKVVPTWLVPTRSRFEADLNRVPREAVYRSPEMAWGLQVWSGPLSDEMVEKSLAEYDSFYAELEGILDGIAARFPRFVVFDLHTYNYRRSGPHRPPADPTSNPEVNVGTGTVDRDVFGRLVDRFIDDLASFDFMGRRLDVRENVKFRGRELARRIHERYPGRACVISIEFKKFFMDEWTGVGDIDQIQQIREALQSTVPGLLEELDRMDDR